MRDLMRLPAFLPRLSRDVPQARPRGAALPVTWVLAALLGAIPSLGQTPGSAGAPAAPLPPRPRVTALAISEPIHFDGVLDDAAWRQAEPASHFIQREP